MVHNTSALIEKFSDDDQLFHCYNPKKRRSDTCIETITTAKKTVKNELDETIVAHAGQSENGDSGTNVPENDRLFRQS